MSTKKYAVFPGNVRSASDGQIHFIDARRLVQLYGVRWDECLVVPTRFEHYRQRDQMMQRISEQGLIKLQPRSSGDYTLPTS